MSLHGYVQLNCNINPARGIQNCSTDAFLQRSYWSQHNMICLFSLQKTVVFCSYIATVHHWSDKQWKYHQHQTFSWHLVFRKFSVPVSIPGSTVGIFLQGENSRYDHRLDRLLEFRFKAPPGTTSSFFTTHTPSAKRNCTSWASQPQKSVTFLPCPGGRTTNST